MSKWVWIIIVLIIVNAILFFFVLRKPKNIAQGIINATNQDSIPGEIPDELGKDFDPTKNPPKFVILGVNKDEETLKIKSVWPTSFEGLETESKIYCREGDIKINGKETSSSEFFTKILSTKGVNIIFSGICVDSTCNEITRSCELFYAE